jgi:hypothetical protein
VRGTHDRRRSAAKLVAGPVLALLVVAAASYAATRPRAGGGPERHGAPVAHPAKAPTLPVVASGSAGLSIAGHPPTVSTHTTARFRVVAAGEPELRCRLDRRRSAPCGTTVAYQGLGAGNHSFFVAARRPGRRTVHADFGWLVLEPKPFTVEPQPTAAGSLYPGAAPLPIHIVISNPNTVPITLTRLQVTAGGGAPGCDPATNVALTVPDLSTAQPRIPAHGSLTLPSATVAAPTIGLRESGVNQDACRGAKFDLAFSGSAGA